MKEEEKELYKRLALNIPNNLHTEIKIKAAKKNISMLGYILGAVIKRLEHDRQYE